VTNENDRSDGTESGEHRSYRLAARAWLAGNLEPLPVGRAADGPRDGETERQFALRSRSIQRSLFDAGYAGITLPEELAGVSGLADLGG
jgi:alkylation response protein AidB-like acyl-CoA dehydrogenase